MIKFIIYIYMGFDVGIIFCAIWENTNPIYSEIRPKYIE